MRNKNIKTKTRFIRASKTARQCISSVQGNEEIRFIDLRSYMKMEEKRHYTKSARKNHCLQTEFPKI